jgi:hypothetical protein
MEEQSTKTQYAVLTVSFGTGDLFKETFGNIDLIIEDRDEFRALGLHKPTRFSSAAAERRSLPWGDKYFVAPEYVRGAGIVAGKLTEGQIARLNECLENRNKN